MFPGLAGGTLSLGRKYRRGRKPFVSYLIKSLIQQIYIRLLPWGKQFLEFFTDAKLFGVFFTARTSIAEALSSVLFQAGCINSSASRSLHCLDTGPAEWDMFLPSLLREQRGGGGGGGPGLPSQVCCVSLWLFSRGQSWWQLQSLHPGTFRGWRMAGHGREHSLSSALSLTGFHWQQQKVSLKISPVSQTCF